MSKNGDGNRKRMTRKGASDCSLSNILFNLGKGNKMAGDDLEEMLLEMIDEKEQESNNKEEQPRTKETYFSDLYKSDWCRQLGLDDEDITIISNLWCRYLDAHYECKVKSILDATYDNSAQGYQHMDRISSLLKKGLIAASTDSRIENLWAGFFFASVDRFLYKHSVMLSMDMIEFISGRKKEILPMQYRPFADQNDHLYSWIGIWDTAWMIFSNSIEHCEFGHKWVIEQNPLIKQMLELQHAREAATPFPLRYKEFCDKYALKDNEILFFTLYMKSDLEEETEPFFGGWHNNPKSYEAMHSGLVNHFRKSNLFRHKLMYVSREGSSVGENESYNHYDISPWAKQALYNDNPSSSKPRQRKEKEIFEEFLEKNKTIELVVPKYKLKNLVLPEKEQQTINRIIAFEKSGTRNKMRSWGVQGWDMGAKGKGFSAIFHGVPGTGKTMAAEAIAKETGKCILKTDSSLILSSWFGQSERNAKEMFNSFNDLCTKTKNPPILLFNEADQLLSTRDAGMGTSADKCWHALQNLFLESLESSGGMIIATTNLLPTLDEAYSRRFDAILEFPIPSRENREKIWKNLMPAKVPGYKTLDFGKVAEYKFSGGQINKVVRNVCLHLASGLAEQEQMTTALVMEFCAKEMQESFEAKDKARKPVGFGKAKGE